MADSLAANFVQNLEPYTPEIHKSQEQPSSSPSDDPQSLANALAISRAMREKVHSRSDDGSSANSSDVRYGDC